MVRLSKLADIEQINKLYYSLFETLAHLEPDYLKKTYQKREFLENIINQVDDFICYVYEMESIVVGFLIAQKQHTPPYECFRQLKGVYIIDIIVDEPFRGMRIGQRLIDAIKDWSLLNKAEYLELSVLAKNQKAYQLYLRQGFEPFEISMKIKL